MLAKDFAIASGHPRTSEAGMEIMRAGGNAVDAVLGAAFMSFVAEPIMAQPFGGGFLAVYDKQGKTRVLDFFGHTPADVPLKENLDHRSILADFGDTQQVFHIGAGTIAVPGVAVGFQEALERYGSLPLRELTAQAIAASRKGMVLDKAQAGVLQIVAKVLESDKATKKLYANDKDTLLEEGEVWINSELADTLTCWSEEGAVFMTEGEAARALVEACAERGAVSLDDMKRYRSVWREPLTMRLPNAELEINPPPSAGGVLVSLMLSLLSEDGGSLTDDSPAIARALILAKRAREMTGHDHNPAIGEKLLDLELLADLRSRPNSFRGTTHISVIDGEGMGAALTLTNGAGSGLLARGTGIHLNDMLGEPDLVPRAEGAFPADVRLCSMMAPAVLRYGGGFVMLGGAGSTRIPSAMVQTLLPLLSGKSCREAVETPRLFYEDKLHIEGFFRRRADGYCLIFIRTRSCGISVRCFSVASILRRVMTRALTRRVICGEVVYRL